MKLLVYILNRVELLDDLLQALADDGVSGATILNSRGMARQLYGDGNKQPGFFSSLRALADPENDDNMTIFAVVREDQIADCIHAIEKVVGELSLPGTGIMFTIPVDFIQGLQ